jgi:hypothetical protein
MDERSDYLTLWTHYENRGYDDKSRMLTSASLLIGISGVLFGAAITCFTASPPQPGASIAMALLSAAVAFLSLVLVDFFAGHADRNFRSADHIRITRGSNEANRLGEGVERLLKEVDDLRKKVGEVSLLGAGEWLSKQDPNKTVGRVFLVFRVISALMAFPPLLLLCFALHALFSSQTCISV